MIDFSYETVYNLYEGFFSSLYLNRFGIFIKILAVTFFLLNVYTNLFSRMGKTFDGGKYEFPFDMHKLLQSLIMVVIVAFYDRLLGYMDYILIKFDSVYSHFSPLDFVPPEEEITDVDLDFDAFSALKQASTEFMRIVQNPTYVFVLLLEGIAWIIDAAIYGVFLFERFFFIGILKILGAIAIVMSVFEKFRDLFYKWIKLYVAVYLLILPFFLIIGFAAYIFKTIDANLSENIAIDLLIGSNTRIILLTILIWLKLRLFKKSYDLVYKLFA